MDFKKKWLPAVFAGVLWGTCEATLGAFFHYLHFPFIGSLLSSIGFICMLWALNKNIDIYQIFSVGIIAAAVKGFDLLLPIDSMVVVRPIISILTQTIVISLLGYFLADKAENLPVVSAVLAPFATAPIMIVLFKFLKLGSFIWTNPEIFSVIKMTLWDSFITSLFTLGFILLGKIIKRNFIKEKTLNFKPELIITMTVLLLISKVILLYI